MSGLPSYCFAPGTGLTQGRRRPTNQFPRRIEPFVRIEGPGLDHEKLRRQETAATERCTWRGRVMRGEVHDENAFALGGAAGHAGLFGTIDGVLDAARCLLQGVDPWLLELRTRQTATRCLGWEARHEGWSGGNACSEETIGHTGFTGTGLWIDSARGLAWTLLTNRVHPTRHRDTGIDTLRRKIGDLIVGQVS